MLSKENASAIRQLGLVYGVLKTFPGRFRDLERIHDGNRHVLPNAFVGFSETDSLDALFARHILNQGSSAAALVELARRKGYELIAAT
jgi:hypothetical protein